jgi:membrane fusion protein, multidrug efflux system
MSHEAVSARPSSPPVRRKAAFPAPALLLLLLAACGKDNTYVPPPPPEVTVSRPEQRTVTDTIELTGNTQSSNTVNLVARVTGFLQSVNFKDGAIVKKGDLLFVIEPSPMRPACSSHRPLSSNSRRR